MKLPNFCPYWPMAKLSYLQMAVITWLGLSAITKPKSWATWATAWALCALSMIPTAISFFVPAKCSQLLFRRSATSSRAGPQLECPAGASPSPENRRTSSRPSTSRSFRTQVTGVSFRARTSLRLLRALSFGLGSNLSQSKQGFRA